MTPTDLSALSPAELCEAYREALRKRFDAQIAGKSRVDYRRGWFYIQKARRYTDGSVGTVAWGAIPAYRRPQFEQMTASLLSRADARREG